MSEKGAGMSHATKGALENPQPCWRCGTRNALGDCQVHRLFPSGTAVTVCTDGYMCWTRAQRDEDLFARLRPVGREHDVAVRKLLHELVDDSAAAPGREPLGLAELLMLHGSLGSGSWAYIDGEDAPPAPSADELRAARLLLELTENAWQAWIAWADEHNVRRTASPEELRDPVGTPLLNRYLELHRDRPYANGYQTAGGYAKERIRALEYAAGREQFGRSIWLVIIADGMARYSLPTRGRWRFTWTPELDAKLRAIDDGYHAFVRGLYLEDVGMGRAGRPSVL